MIAKVPGPLKPQKPQQTEAHVKTQVVKQVVDFNLLFQIFQTNLYPEMVECLSTKLGVSIASINRLGIGWHPGHQAWVTREYDDRGNVIGLLERYQDVLPDIDLRKGRGHSDTKRAILGGARGLAYECLGSISEKAVYEKHYKWVPCRTAKVDCPVCHKHGWCMVAGPDSNNPDACLCGHVKEGSAYSYESGCGHVHILKARSNESTQILPASPFPILVVEGASDTLAAMDLGRIAVGKPGAELGDNHLASLLRGKDVIIVGDNDKDGIGKRGMDKTFNILRPICKSVSKVLPPPEFKDLRSWMVTAKLTPAEFRKWIVENAEMADNSKVLERIYPQELAEKFLDNKHNGRKRPTLRYFLKSWYAFDKSHYAKLDDVELDGQLYDFFRPFELARSVGKTKICEPIKVDKRLIDDVIHVLRPPCLTAMPGHAFDGFSLGGNLGFDPNWVVPFANGLYDVEHDKFLPPDPNFFITTTLPHNYDVNAKCPKWLWFCEDVFNGDTESIDLLQCWFGYNQVYSNSIEQLMVLSGQPCSGKGTVTHTLEEMLGRNKVDSLSLSQLISNFGKQSLLGKNTLLISEEKLDRTSESSKAVAVINRITGRGDISVDRKYLSAVTGPLTCKITYDSNHDLTFNDPALSLIRRLNVLCFPNNYEATRDSSLKEKLAREAQGVSMWALTGLRRLYANKKFTEPKATIEFVATLKEILSPIVGMITECCDVEKGAMPGSCQVQVDTLYKVYTNYCREYNHTRQHIKTFGKQLLREYPHIEKTRPRKDGDRVSHYVGIKLKPGIEENQWL